MSSKITVTINDKPIHTQAGKTVLEVCEENAIHIPVMCHFKGLTDVGACRLCLVEIKGINKLLPACTTTVSHDQEIETHTERITTARRLIVEMFFSERNHMCSICVANGSCELQDLAKEVGMDHVRLPFLSQPCEVDASHERFVHDDNRCVMCTRCVRVCDEVEGAHNWDVRDRGYKARIIADFNLPWGESTTCTSCSKCVDICPTGALWEKGVAQGKNEKNKQKIRDLIEQRENQK